MHMSNPSDSIQWMIGWRKQKVVLFGVLQISYNLISHQINGDRDTPYKDSS